MTDDPTWLIIQWALSRPVLAHHLRMIALDAPQDETDRHQELICTVVDLLDPQRSRRWAEVLRATGASTEDADALWRLLGGNPNGWMTLVRWEGVRGALLALPPLDL